MHGAGSHRGAASPRRGPRGPSAPGARRGRDSGRGVEVPLLCLGLFPPAGLPSPEEGPDLGSESFPPRPDSSLGRQRGSVGCRSCVGAPATRAPSRCHPRPDRAGDYFNPLSFFFSSLFSFFLTSSERNRPRWGPMPRSCDALAPPLVLLGVGRALSQGGILGCCGQEGARGTMPSGVGGGSAPWEWVCGGGLGAESSAREFLLQLVAEVTPGTHPAP